MAALTAAIEAALEVGITTIDLSDAYCQYRDGFGHDNDRFAEVLRLKVRAGWVALRCVDGVDVCVAGGITGVCMCV